MRGGKNQCMRIQASSARPSGRMPQGWAVKSKNGGYPVWAICRLQAVLFYIFNRFDDIKLLVRRQPTEIGEKPIPQRRHKSFKFFNLFQRRIG